MNYERKQIIVQALIKLVQSAPETQMQAQTQTFNLYSQNSQNFQISQQAYKIWLDYVYSVLDTTYEYTGSNRILEKKMYIIQLSNQVTSYAQVIAQIKNVILGLAQEILQYY